MRRALLCGLFGLAVALFGVAGLPQTPPEKPPVVQPTIEELAQQYRRLRAKKVEPGVFDEETYGFNGQKHEVMDKLVERLGENGTTRARIEELMGKPDLVVRPRDHYLWNLVSGDRGDAELVLIYCWRGQHDFAWFGLRRRVVVAKGWWFAGE